MTDNNIIKKVVKLLIEQKKLWRTYEEGKHSLLSLCLKTKTNFVKVTCYYRHPTNANDVELPYYEIELANGRRVAITHPQVKEIFIKAFELAHEGRETSEEKVLATFLELMRERPRAWREGDEFVYLSLGGGTIRVNPTGNFTMTLQSGVREHYDAKKILEKKAYKKFLALYESVYKQCQKLNTLLG